MPACRRRRWSMASGRPRSVPNIPVANAIVNFFTGQNQAQVPSRAAPIALGQAPVRNASERPRRTYENDGLPPASIPSDGEASRQAQSKPFFGLF